MNYVEMLGVEALSQRCLLDTLREDGDEKSLRYLENFLMNTWNQFWIWKGL